MKYVEFELKVYNYNSFKITILLKRLIILMDAVKPVTYTKM